jgi:hypothetical protein
MQVIDIVNHGSCRRVDRDLFVLLAIIWAHTNLLPDNRF